MKVIAHQVCPVCILHHPWQVKPPEIPIGGGYCKGYPELPWGIVEGGAKSFHQLNEVFGVFRVSPTVWGTGILPVNIKSGQQLGRYRYWSWKSVFSCPEPSSLTHQIRNAQGIVQHYRQTSGGYFPWTQCHQTPVASQCCCSRSPSPLC